MPQTASTSELDKAQGTVIETARYTAEHSAPCINLVEYFRLNKGQSTVTVPKVGQMNADVLADGEDIVDEEDIGMTTVDLTAAEIGLKVILTDKLVRQMVENTFTIVGRQMGDAVARKKDLDVIALFPTLYGGGTAVQGGDNKYLSLQNAQACCSYAKAHKFGGPLAFVHHPNAIAYMAAQAATAAATYPMPDGYSADLLASFYSGIRLNGVGFFEDGNIPKEAGVDSGIGAIFAKGAIAYLESVGFNAERQRDASVRGTELVVTADYGLFELDDTKGVGAQYEIGDAATDN